MRPITTFLFLSCGLFCYGQISTAQPPLNWGNGDDDRSTIPSISLHPLDVQALVDSEDLGSDELKYGVQRVLSANVVQEGVWTQLPNGDRSCRLLLRSPGAAMLSVQFDQWELPVSATVHLYNEDRNFYIGGFTMSNRNPDDGSMATAVVPGDAVVIEYRMPAQSPTGDLHVASITHGYRDLFNFREAGYLRDYWPGYASHTCNINVNCPQAAAWQDQKKSVAMFLRPDGGGCSGNLINAVHAPGRPLFHMANHCYQPTTSQYVFYFNYEAPACVGDTGQTVQTLTGASLLAIDYYDDFALLKLTNSPQAAGYDVYYAGWDRSGATPQTGTVIHHPAYDVKKITFDTNPLTSYSAGGTQLWRSYWNQGIVEGVSSGGPLFDQNKRMVGHMNEGAQDCTNSTTLPTGCAKFSASWDGVSSVSRLRDWLDSANTGVSTLNGFAPPLSSPSVKVSLRAFLEGPFNTTNGLMKADLRANGVVPLNEPYSGLGYTHTGGGGGETTSASVLSVSNANAIVDWVVVELRAKNDSALVVATRSALLQRDGDIVSTDGTSPVTLNMPSDQYYIAVRHRTHLGIMAAGRYALSSTPTSVDLTNGTAALYGGSAAIKILSGKQVMFAGDVNGDNQIVYTNTNNDRDLILTLIGGVVPTATLSGYHAEDVNMDGVVSYTGVNNDRDIILINIGGITPTNVLDGSIP
ncbi:MAG: hypothetical protein IPI00_03095 [Flavobacteriales bacterium]|nr:hypothetical protein [Flavobacteriales bacterium]